MTTQNEIRDHVEVKRKCEEKDEEMISEENDESTFFTNNLENSRQNFTEKSVDQEMEVLSDQLR